MRRTSELKKLPSANKGLQKLLRSVLRLLVTTKFTSLPIIFTLMMEAIRSSETSFLTRGTRHNIPEDGIVDSYVGSVMDKAAPGQISSEYFGFHCQAFH
jgi:hypothetical protein